MSVPEKVDQIRLHFRLSKAAERTRIQIDHGLVAFARTHLTAWTPGLDAKARKREADRARTVVMALLTDKEVPEADLALAEAMSGLILGVKPARDQLSERESENEKEARRLAEGLPGWERHGQQVRGFSLWSLATLVAEAGDLTNFGGPRYLYKRLGLAPPECYPTGQKSGGRMIPRQILGHIMGIIASPLFKHQWRGEKDGTPAHAIGPYGEVYAEAKASRVARIEAGELGPTGKPRPRAWADRSARRAMVKALICDVWCAWNGKPLHYARE